MAVKLSCYLFVIGLIHLFAVTQALAGATAVAPAAKATAAGPSIDGLYEQAALELKNLNIEKARKLYQEIDRLSPEASIDKLARGRKARVMLKAHLPLYPVSQECNDLYKQGEVLLHSKDAREALNAFDELSRRYPKFEWALTAKAYIYMRLGDTEKAAQCAREALQINENFLEAWTLLIHDCMMHNDMEGQINAIHKAQQLDPTDAMMNNMMLQVIQEKAKQFPD